MWWECLKAYLVVKMERLLATDDVVFQVGVQCIITGEVGELVKGWTGPAIAQELATVSTFQ